MAATKTTTFPFVFNCATGVFPADELAALVEHGGRLEALVSGTIMPSNKTDRHFLEVERGDALPKTLLERAWDRLKGRREYEREQAAAPPHEPTPDYGIQEFDKDPCWW